MLYPKGAHILTFKGWLPLIEKDTIMSDLITFNRSSGCIEEGDNGILVKPKKVREHSVVRNEYIDTVIDTESLPADGRFLLAVNKTKTYIELEHFTDSEIYILGMILTDAYYNKSGGIEIYQAAKKKFIVERIDGALSELKYEGSLSQKDIGGKQYTWRIGKKSADLFKEKFDLQERGDPPIEYLFLSHKKRELLLDAMMDGDGTWNDYKKTYGIFYKPQIISFFQLMAMSLGYKCKINNHRKQIYISKSGFDGSMNYTEPTIQNWHSPFQMFELEGLENQPLILMNGKIYIGG
jgi:hypothetical protein